MTSSRPYLVRAMYEWLTDNDLTPLAVVDATAGESLLPEAFVENGQIVLNLAPGAIRNLNMANDYVSFDARFSGKAMQVYFPSDAVLAIYARENGQGMVFDAPPPGQGQAGEDDDPDEPPPAGGGGPKLRIVK